MNKRILPLAIAGRVAGVQCEIPATVLERWQPGIRAKKGAAIEINIFDVIGRDPWSGDGVALADVHAALNAVGEKAEVVVNINSPGGDMFEGMAIYNRIRQHQGQITVRVLGLAASAASIIAMAGDKIEVGKTAYLMIHNAWTIAAGNRHQFRDIADLLEPFDNSLAEVYAAISEAPTEDMAALMDAETWMTGQQAVEQGFADSLLASDEVSSEPSPKAEVAIADKMDKVLAKAGMSRTERRKLMQEFRAGKRDAADPDAEGKRDAAEIERITSEIHATLGELRGLLP